VGMQRQNYKFEIHLLPLHILVKPQMADSNDDKFAAMEETIRIMQTEMDKMKAQLAHLMRPLAKTMRECPNCHSRARAFQEAHGVYGYTGGECDKCKDYLWVMCPMHCIPVVIPWNSYDALPPAKPDNGDSICICANESLRKSCIKSY
jgi:hypothetical protein